MCGISLLINTRNLSVPGHLIREMNNKVIHRGPDGEGIYKGNHFAMGHRRLSIIDLSDAGRQPMFKEDDCIIFNGMIYNFIELKQELISWGHVFHSNSDTEVLLAACRQWGIDAFKKLNGMWAFAWYRADQKEIILCRDYFGIKPLYYTTIGDLFAAGSEIKQFTDLPGFEPVLNKNTAINFLVNGSLNYSEQTFFEGVNELKGGHYMVYNLQTHQYKVQQWYHLAESSPQKSIPMEEAIMEVGRLFADSIRIRMRSDVPVGSCLSGGIDSTAIVSYLHAQKMTAADFATITSCYKDKKFDEQLYSDVVTEKTGFRKLKVFPDLKDLLDNNELDSMLYHQDQPFSTASHYSEHQVFKTAQDNRLTVMLDGQGSDEFFCGYDEFFITYLKQLLHTRKIKKFLHNVRSKSKHEGTNMFNILKRYCKTVYWYPIVTRLKPMIGRANPPWLSSSWSKLTRHKLVKFIESNIRELSLHQMVYSSLPLQLHSEDRNSMMFSIESRLPFLDHRLVEYVMSLPDELKIKDGYSKYVLREAISEMPSIIRKRTLKMGFVAPDETWIRDNQQRLRKELEEAIKHTGIFSENLLHRFDRFINGALNYEPIYFRAITLNRFINIFKMQLQSAEVTNLNLKIPTCPSKLEERA